MTRSSRLATTLGFAVPSALAAGLVFGVDAHATPRELRPPWAPSYAAYKVNTRLVRACEPEFPGQMVCECPPRIEVELAPDRLRAFITAVDGMDLEPSFLPMSVPRDGHEWAELERWFAGARSLPIFDGVAHFQVFAAAPLRENYQTFRSFPEAAPYRDLIRVIEIADHAGFDDARLIPARAAESTRDPMSD